MPLLNAKQCQFAEAVAHLTYCNPFLEGRIEYEREALGSDFSEARPGWNIHPEFDKEMPNVKEILERADTLVLRTQEKLKLGDKATAKELYLYESLVLCVLYYRYLDRLQEASRKILEIGSKNQTLGFYRDFEKEARPLLAPGSHRLPASKELPHIFAIFFQIRRAFFQIFTHIIGLSPAAVRLRGMVWESIFTHDLRRYRLALYHRMGDLATLVTGPSGTGKELVARAIGLSRYIPFDPASLTFVEDVKGSFMPLNLSALSPTLIESELFGHCRGSFTGAQTNRQGWLELCPAMGTVFLDEIGEIDMAIQVKLLRVLENRKFQRLGESKDRSFKGKIISATNRNLVERMGEELFREDLYYRLCADLVVMPSLHERVVEAPEELDHLVQFIARREVDDEKEADSLAKEVIAWVDTELGRNYAWPGNIRELSQCVRNVLVRKAYRPPARVTSGNLLEQMARSFTEGTLGAEEMMSQYCTMVYSRCGSYEEAARQLGLDRRTVKAKVDTEFLKKL